VVLPCYAGPFKGRVDYQVNRALAHSAAGQRRQKFTNKGADGLFGLIVSDFFADFELRTNTSQHLVYFYIHAVKCICQGTNAHFVI
jgi:hypothetical protein